MKLSMKILLLSGIPSLCAILVVVFLHILFGNKTNIYLGTRVKLEVNGVVDFKQVNNGGLTTREFQTKDGIHISVSDLPGGLHRVLMWHGVEFKQDKN